MDQIKNLEPNIRCQALVGRFLQEWGLVESRLNDVVIRALGLDNIAGLIVVKNIQLRDKIKIAQSSIRVNYLKGEDVEKYKKLLKDVNRFSAKRNTIAHEIFFSNDEGNVEFLMIKATDGLSFPREVWTIDEFFVHFHTMRRFGDELSELIKKMRRAALVRALTSTQETDTTSALRLLGFQNAADGQSPSEADAASLTPDE